MATFKSIEPNQKNVNDMQLAMFEVDAAVQEADENIMAAVTAIKAMLTQPDSAHLRRSIRRLCIQMEEQSAIATNCANGKAGEWHANYIDEAGRQEEDAIDAAFETNAKVTQ